MTADANPTPTRTDPGDTVAGPRQGLVRLLVGAAQGLALYALHASWDAKGSWAQGHPALFWGLAVAAAGAPIVVLGGLTLMRARVLAAWTVVAAVALFGLAFHAVAREAGVDTTLGGGLPAPPFQAWVSMAVSLYIAHHLVAAADVARRPIAPYPIYFDITWKDAVQLGLSGAFVGVFWAILFLGGSLFDLIGLKGFGQMIREDWFAYPATALVFAAAVHVTDVRAGLVRGLRTVALALLSWLTPLLGLIGAAFLAALPLTGLDPLWNTGSAAGLLLGSAAGMVILVNATYQDGGVETRAPVILRHAGRLAALLILPLVGLAGYAIALRVGQHGWTPDRVTGAACLLVGLLYGAGYLFAALRPGDWLRPLERTNILTAAVALAVLLAILTPVADPGRISAANQLARIQRGGMPANRFDFGFLKFEAGRYGVAALRTLAASKTPAIAQAARAELARKDRFLPPPDTSESLRARIKVRPAGHDLPPALLTALGNGGLIVCGDGCEVTFADLDGDRTDDALVRNGSTVTLWATERTGAWRAQGDYHLNACTTAAFAQGPVRQAPPRFGDLVLAGRRVQLTHDGVPADLTPGGDDAACAKAPAR